MIYNGVLHQTYVLHIMQAFYNPRTLDYMILFFNFWQFFSWYSFDALRQLLLRASFWLNVLSGIEYF